MSTASEWPSSVWEGNDADLLRWMIPFYTAHQGQLFPTRSLDCTYGDGTMWKGWPSGTPTYRIDVRQVAERVILMDNRALGFLAATFSLLVYDPPHISEGSRSDMHWQYSESGSANVSGLFGPFMAEAYRVLRGDGVLMVKIADQVHRNQSQWQHCDAKAAAEAAGFELYDLIVKIRRTAMMGKWKRARHARKYHSFWLIFTKGRRR